MPKADGRRGSLLPRHDAGFVFDPPCGAAATGPWLRLRVRMTWPDAATLIPAPVHVGVLRPGDEFPYPERSRRRRRRTEPQ